MPEWRNGRRDGLKIRCPQGRVGSSPSSGTLKNPVVGDRAALGVAPQKVQLLGARLGARLGAGARNHYWACLGLRLFLAAGCGSFSVAS